MIVFRLTKKKYRNQLSGIGAEIYSGRWNSKGKRMVYTGANIALCTAEVAVHLPLGILPQDYFLQTIKLPKASIKTLAKKELPANWLQFPYNQKTKLVGNKFLEDSKYLVLKVPSAVVQGEHNYLLNPSHKDMKKVKLIKTMEFNFDDRLFIK